MKFSLEVLSAIERSRIHEASLAVLRKTGMRFESEELLSRLAATGAKVDRSSGTAFFPEAFVEQAIAGNQSLLKQGRKLYLLNGVTSEPTPEGRIKAKVSGGCEKYLDWETQTVREADARHLLDFIRLGETTPEVSFVGNPILIRDEERMRRIRTAALIAMNTRKLGSMEVWEDKEIDFLVEIGTIARGSREKYYEQPCLVTAKETISPLFLDRKAGEVLLGLARRNLPCTIIPMPLAGLSAPVTRLGSAIIGNAEILGVMAAVKAFYPEALVGAGSITGVLDMRTGVVSFSAPEAILQDLAIAEVHQKLYGFDYLIGSGYTDARVPGAQTVAEKLMKYLFTCLSGRCSYPVGLLQSGSVFSDVQALVDIELCRYIHGHFGEFGDVAAIPELLELIDRAGIRGNYVTEEHTLRHFRESWLPEFFDRSSDASRDLYANAWEKAKSIYAYGEYWEIEPEKRRAIEEVVRRAQQVL